MKKLSIQKRILLYCNNWTRMGGLYNVGLRGDIASKMLKYGYFLVLDKNVNGKRRRYIMRSELGDNVAKIIISEQSNRRRFKYFLFGIM